MLSVSFPSVALHLFSQSSAEQLRSAINRSTAVHIYNNMCEGQGDAVKTGTPLFSIMEENCPLTAEQLVKAKTETDVSKAVQ